jgi:hypothetical protein
MGTWKSVAVIQVDQIIPAVHLLAARHHAQVLVTLLVVPHALIQRDLHRVHQDQIQIDVAKIYRRAVVHLLDQVRQVEIAKGEMPMIRAVFAQRLWIAINHDCVREFSSQIFLKMLQVKNLKKQLAQNY